jgi:hypothetical protein
MKSPQIIKNRTGSVPYDPDMLLKLEIQKKIAEISRVVGYRVVFLPKHIKVIFFDPHQGTFSLPFPTYQECLKYLTVHGHLIPGNHLIDHTLHELVQVLGANRHPPNARTAALIEAMKPTLAEMLPILVDLLSSKDRLKQAVDQSMTPVDRQFLDWQDGYDMTNVKTMQDLIQLLQYIHPSIQA